MKAYIFFSVHVPLFDGILQRMRSRGIVSTASGFVWGLDQAERLARSSVCYEKLAVFTRDVLDRADASPDLDYLADCEAKHGVPLATMIAAERHLTKRYGYERVLSIVEQTFRLVSRLFETQAPDFVLSEDVSCLTSYIHWAVARSQGIPFFIISSARTPGRIVVYRDGLQEWDRTNIRYAQLRREGLSTEQRASAQDFVDRFRREAERPSGMDERARLPLGTWDDLRRISNLTLRYVRDPKNPVLSFPATPFLTRGRRLFRANIATQLFEPPRVDERYVLYPIHLQPEASTLVQAPYFLNQVAVIEDLVKSLPAGVRLYVKDHVSTRGRWPLSFYRSIKECFGVRLIDPDADVPSLIKHAEAVAVITGTMGWEAALFEKPVLTFGNVFFNVLPQVRYLGATPKTEWGNAIREAIGQHQPDPEALLCFVEALLQTTSPGFMANPTTFPRAADPANLDLLTNAVAERLRELTPLAAAHSTSR